MNEHFLTPLPRLAAQLVQASLLRARKLHKGRLPSIPEESFAIMLQGLGFALEFSQNTEGQVEVSSLRSPKATTVIKGSPASLALQASNQPPGGRIEIQGDATLAQRWQHYFGALNPDWEQSLSDRLGPVLGFQLSKLFGELRDFTRSSQSHTADMLSEYLQEESRLLVTRIEMQVFLNDVDDLNERMERLLAQHPRLQYSHHE